MKIIELRAQNVKRLTAVNIKPDGNIVEIRGANGAGKSSVLDAIYMALGGKGASPELPIRQGQSKASVFLDLGDGLQVRREWSSGSGTKLTVTGKKGGTPQAVLDALVGKLTFDPLDFMRMKPADQQATLLDLLGIQDTLLELDDREDRHVVERREAKKRVDEATKAAESYSVPNGTPDQPISIDDLTKELAQAHDTIRTYDLCRWEVGNLSKKSQAALDACERLFDQLVEAQLRVAKLNEELIKTKTEHAKVIRLHEAASGKANALVDPDTSVIKLRMQQAAAINENVATKARRDELRASSDKWGGAVTHNQDAIEAVRLERRQLLEGVTFPVPGLSIDSGQITFNCIPFDQCCASEQLRVSLHIGMGENPTLKVLRVKDGSLLDGQTLQQLYDEVIAKDYQLWIERVGEDGDIGIVIEDGHVRGGEQTDSGKAAETSSDGN